jgi:ribosomal-protein-alanine N-acetyltransferase
LAERYLEINGRWEDHVRYAMTFEEWQERGDDLVRTWVD